MNPSGLRIEEWRLRHRISESLQRLQSRHYLRKILVNAGWLISGRMLRMALVALIGVWQARYLGASGYGNYAYAVSFAGLFMAFSNLGTEQIIKRQLARSEEDLGEWLGTSLALMVTGGLATFAAATLAISLMPDSTPTTVWMVGIISSTAVIASYAPIDLLFQTRLQSRHSVLARTSGLLFMVLSKAVMILLEAPLVLFAVASLIEVSVTAAAFAALYLRRERERPVWRISLEKSRYLLRESWPLMLSQLGVIFYGEIDKIMLGTLAGFSAVGVYTVYLALLRVPAQFLAQVNTSVNPSLVRAYEKSEAGFWSKYDEVSALYSWVSLWVVASLCLIGTDLVTFVFGQEFAAGSSLMVILAVRLLIQFPGLLSVYYLVIIGQTRLILVNKMIGLGVNVLLNLWLIPIYGLHGAALATLVTFLVTAYLFNFWFDATRPLVSAFHRAVWRAVKQEPLLAFFRSS